MRNVLPAAPQPRKFKILQTDLLHPSIFSTPSTFNPKTLPGHTIHHHAKPPKTQPSALILAHANSLSLRALVSSTPNRAIKILLKKRIPPPSQNKLPVKAPGRVIRPLPWLAVRVACRMGLKKKNLYPPSPGTGSSRPALLLSRLERG